MLDKSYLHFSIFFFLDVVENSLKCVRKGFIKTILRKLSLCSYYISINYVCFLFSSLLFGSFEKGNIKKCFPSKAYHAWCQCCQTTNGTMLKLSIEMWNLQMQIYIYIYIIALLT